MESALRTLNPAQREAVSSEAQVLQVLAPPGSGKTKTLTARVAHLISTGLQPWNIIVCTFTVKAAREMQTRIRDLVEDSNKIKIGTFHGIALRYLRKHRTLVGLSQSFGVADTSDSTAILRRILKLSGNTIDASSARSRISGLKAKGIDCETFAQREGKQASQANFLRLYQEYQAELRRSGLLDYDDILLRCVDLLRAHPHCVENVQAVLVDEFQDTNHVQYELMSLFAQRHQRITIVGDPDQSIYGWRSAEIRNLHRMRARWNDTITINLEENYRSSGSILVAAQAVIEQDQSRPPKALQATLNYGHKPVLRRLPSARDESVWLVEEIRRICALSGSMLCFNDFAVLLRTASLSRMIESSLGSAGIPYRMVGGTKFFDRAEVKIVLDYLRVIDNPSHNEALARVLNVPPRRIGDKTLENLQAEGHKKSVSLWSLVQGLACGKLRLTANISQVAMKGIEQFTNVIQSCRKHLKRPDSTVADIIKTVIHKIDLQSFLRSKYAEEHETKMASVEELISQATELPVSQQDISSSQSIDQGVSTALSGFLENVALAASVDAQSNAEPTALVTISTMHAAKGLEWPVVFVPACYNGSIPHSRSEDHDEERRLLYVAMTRAQAMLYLSCPVKDSQMQETVLSAFVSQPDCAKLFHQHGPAFNQADMHDLAKVLRRSGPDAAAIRGSTADLLRDSDDYWPDDGSPPVRDHSTLTMHGTPSTEDGDSGGGDKPLFSGFASVRGQFNELSQQARRLGQQRDLKSSKEVKPDQKVIAGSRKISAFFTAQSTTTMSSSTVQQTNTGLGESKDVLVDITARTQHGNNINHMQQQQQHGSVGPSAIRNEPLYKRQRLHELHDKGSQWPATFVMSPDESQTLAGVSSVPTYDAAKQPLQSQGEYKAASTMHITSFQAATTGRRTLGVKRSMNGWAQRGQLSNRAGHSGQSGTSEQ